MCTTSCEFLPPLQTWILPKSNVLIWRINGQSQGNWQRGWPGTPQRVSTLRMESWQSQFHLHHLLKLIRFWFLPSYPPLNRGCHCQRLKQILSLSVLFSKGNLQNQTSQRGCISCPTQCSTERGTKDPAASLSGCEVSFSYVSDRSNVFKCVCREPTF